MYLMVHTRRIDNRPPFSCRRAFSLVELMVVVAILSALVAVLAPALSRARRAGQSVKCMSNMRQILAAAMMYQQDHDGFFARTMANEAFGPPETLSWWSVQGYQRALERYIMSAPGGVSEDGALRGKGNSVWFDPADPDSGHPAMWGSFSDNGLITGVRRNENDIWRPSETIYAGLRHADWALVLDVTVPEPLPVSDPTDPFWSSEYFDMCLDPWADSDDPSDPYHWSAGRAAPPCSLFPDDPGCADWDQQIDGRHPRWREGTPRYGSTPPYAYCDGHVERVSFESTYAGPEGNQWDVR